MVELVRLAASGAPELLRTAWSAVDVAGRCDGPLQAALGDPHRWQLPYTEAEAEAAVRLIKPCSYLEQIVRPCARALPNVARRALKLVAPRDAGRSGAGHVRRRAHRAHQRGEQSRRVQLDDPPGLPAGAARATTCQRRCARLTLLALGAASRL